MTDFTKQNERIDDDIKQLELIDLRLFVEEKKIELPTATIIELLGLSIKIKNRIAQEIGHMERKIEKPNQKNLVYSKFDEDIHVINCDFNPSLPITLSIEWGGIDPFVILVWQKISGRGDVIVDEVYEACIDNNRLIELCKERDWWRHTWGATAYCDPSRQDLIREWREEGIHLIGCKSLIDDINLVRAALAPMKGEPTLFINRKCKMVIWEFNHYWTHPEDGHPIEKSNHSMNAIRYYVRGIKTKQKEVNKMADFTKQEERVRDDVEKLEILNKLISTEQAKKELDVHTIMSLINDALRIKNRIAAELGQAKNFKKGGE